MTFEDYIAIDACNWSSLKNILRSPLHYHHALTAPRTDSPAMAMGRAVHTAILEPDEFPTRYVVVSDAWLGDDRLNRSKSEGKAFKDTLPDKIAGIKDASAYKAAVFAHEHPGQSVVTRDEYARCLAMRNAVHAHVEARGYILGSGANEVSHVWTDPTTGLKCKGRLDRVSDAPAAIVDVKTTRDVDSVTFGRTAAKLGYHGQFAFYQSGWEAVTGVRLPCVIVAVESDAPHDVAVIDVDEDSLEAGREDVRRALSMLVECRESGVWPGRYPQRVALQLPGWVFPDGDVADLGLDFGSESEEAA